MWRMWRGFWTPISPLLREVCGAERWLVAKFTGDGVMAVFGGVMAREDDPSERSVVG